MIKNRVLKFKLDRLFKIITLIICLCFLKIPIIFCRDISYDYFNSIGLDIFAKILYWLFELLYILIIVWIILKIKAHKLKR